MWKDPSRRESPVRTCNSEQCVNTNFYSGRIVADTFTAQLIISGSWVCLALRSLSRLSTIGIAKTTFSFGWCPSTIYKLFPTRLRERVRSRRGWPLLRISRTLALTSYSIRVCDHLPPLTLVVLRAGVEARHVSTFTSRRHRGVLIQASGVI